MTEHIVKVSDFTQYPGGRRRKDGDFSGEEFREKWLRPAVLAAVEATGDTVVVSLDGVAGFSSSFLEEIFGGIVRTSAGIPPERVAGILSVRVTDPALEGFKADALKYLSKAVAAARAR